MKGRKLSKIHYYFETPVQKYFREAVGKRVCKDSKKRVRVEKQNAPILSRGVLNIARQRVYSGTHCNPTISRRAICFNNFGGM